MAYRRNQLVTYNRKRWRVIRKGQRVGYDLATVENGKTVIRINVPSSKINKVKRK